VWGLLCSADPWCSPPRVARQLVYAGIGWLVFREKSDLPDELVFTVNYLGGNQVKPTVN
jgi:hypothetical protein